MLRITLGSEAAPGGVLKSWSASDFAALKFASTRERDPAGGGNAQWKGVPLSKLIDQAIEGLTVEQRSGIDLVILKNAAGAKAFIPRSLVTKYPILIASIRDGKPLAAPRGPLLSVVPWTSRPKITDEELPLESYLIPGLSEVELTSYKNLYGAYFLKRRTDPVAMRGEKIFVQTCLGCHAGADPIPQSDAVASASHAAVKGFPRLQDRNRRAVQSYIDAHRGETNPVVKTGGSGSAADSAVPAVSRN